MKISHLILIPILTLALFPNTSYVLAQTEISDSVNNINSAISQENGLVLGDKTIVSSPTTDSNYHTQESFSVPVLLASPTVAVNAFSMRVEYPENLEFIGSDDNNSIVNFWVEKPQIEDGQIIFSGIIPSGFTEIINPLNQKRSPGLITQLVFQGKKEGVGQIRIISELYSNDGLGTPVESFDFSIKVSIDNIVSNKTYIWNDKTLPEVFAPTIEQDPLIFDNKYFLAFSAIDKGSGIDHYEVREGGGSWSVAQSPYLLIDQGLSSDIFVKAIDKAGNTRTVKITAKNVKSEKPVSKTQVSFAFLISILIIYLLKKKYRRNN